MKKRNLISFIICFCMMFNFMTVAKAEGELVTQRKLIGNNLTVSGYGKNVDIFLLNPGKTVADLNNAVTDAEFDEVVNYCNMITTGVNNKYSDTFEIMNADEEAIYKLYVKDGEREYISDVRLSNKIYVSVDAPAGGDGSLAKPYASIEEARNSIAKEELDSSVEVILKGGEYKIYDEIFFGPDNSGTEEYSITYKAADGEKVVLSGTTELDVSKIKKVTDAGILNKVDESVRGKLVVIDLAEQGIPESVVDFNQKLAVGSTGKPMRLFLNGAQQDLARWPNAGYQLINYSEGGGNVSGKTTELGGAVIGLENLDEVRAARWQNAENMYIEGYIANGWHREWAKVGSIDVENAKVNLKTYTQYGTAVGMRAAAVNLIEELDIAGEWYADADTMKLYYYPPHELTDKDSLEIATLCENFMTFSGASYLNVDGIEFKGNADSPLYQTTNDNGGNGIVIKNRSSYINTSNCKLHDIGMDGITIKNSTDVGVDSCVIYNTGYRGIYVESGDRDTQKSGNVVITNCHISDASRDSGSNSVVGILISGGVGTVIENNVFSNMRNSAIRYGGNGHLISKNEFYNCAYETTDAGAIYAGRSWSQYGTVIQNNYFHDIGDPTLDYVGVGAVFWDDNHSGNSFIGNIVNMNQKTKTSGIRVGGGRDNLVKGNIFVNSLYGISGEDRSANVTDEFVESDASNWFNQTLFMSFKDAANIEAHPYYITAENWKESYKSLYPDIMVNFNDIVYNKSYKRANTYSNNVFYNCDDDGFLDFLSSNYLNLGSKHKSESTQKNNKNYTSTSNFVNYNGGDFRVKNSAALCEEMPDENFDMSSIGIRKSYAIEDMEFDLMYPVNNASFAKTATELKWERVSQADTYTYQVATDAGFSNVVASGTTKLNVAEVSGLSLNTQYYWRVTANSISTRFGASEASESVYTFNTSGEVSFDAVNYNAETDCAEFVVSNTTGTEQPTIAVVAVKDASGKLLGVRSEKLEGNASEVKSVSAVFDDVSGVSTVECYVWYSYEGMKNVGNKKAFKLN